LHSPIVDYAYNMCTDRSDVFMVFDCVGISDNITTAVSEVSSIDNNYSATYYPWVKILDANINKPVWVPPSVVIPGVLAFNDRVAAEWYAPAGLNRGGLTSVLDAYTRLTHAERDELYEGRINPIATFPGVGVCVWGQKTLQAKASALDRINVRRLLIAVKKYIASATKYLVFEQNTAATRNRFLNIVNPYLESIQQRQGLYAFRVVMDETNNTPDLIDRNIMYGQIFLQPTKTAEFIIIDFNILPTGATFPGA
jgi:phage tail sheath protein FI